MSETEIHTRIVQVEIIETITRVAHLELTSEAPIDEQRVRESASVLKESADSVACERDFGSDVEITLIGADQSSRYRLSVDGHIDLDEE